MGPAVGADRPTRLERRPPLTTRDEMPCRQGNLGASAVPLAGEG
jgi:hypothetical protein